MANTTRMSDPLRMFRRDPHFTRFESPIAEAFPPSGKAGWTRWRYLNFPVGNRTDRRGACSSRDEGPSHGQHMPRTIPHPAAEVGQPFRAVRDVLRDPLHGELVGKGQRVAEYISYGPKWLPYFGRRLRDRPRHMLTMARAFVTR